MNVEEFRIHPIKSTRHINVDSFHVLSHGIRFDREWALFDDTGQVVTSRTHPKLLDIHCSISDGALSFRYKGANISVAPSGNQNYAALNIFSYDAHGSSISDELDEWFSNYLDLPCRLMQVSLKQKRPVLAKHGGTIGDQVGFGDQAPILILSKSSLDDLNGRLEEPIGMERFRPNIIISGTEAYSEDHWGMIQIGSVKLRVIQQCERCVLTTIDNTTKQKHPKSEPLRTLSTYRKGPRGGVVFGVHAVPMNTGTVYLNNDIRVTTTMNRPVVNS